MTAAAFGKYKIVEKIGAGGFGEVFKGLDPFLNRPVAIKTCSSDDAELRKRFFREAEIAANLQHPNIVTIFDFGHQDETPYLVQEYLNGEDLDHKIRRREPMTTSTRLDVLQQIATGLDYAHSRDVVHRDVKPSNIRILEDGQVRIMDFGIAKLLTAETQLTRTGMAMGTAAYLPPEQIMGQPVDRRGDLFSFGVLAFELMTFERPFEGDSLSAMLYAIAHKEPRPLAGEGVACPPRLATLIETCLAKDPAARYPGFSEVIAELQSLSQTPPLPAVPPAPPPVPAGPVPAAPPPPSPPTEPSVARLAAPSDAPPSDAPPSVATPSVATPSGATPSGAAPSMVPPSAATEVMASPPAEPTDGARMATEAIAASNKTGRLVVMAVVGAFVVSLLVAVGLGAWLLGRWTDGARNGARPESPAPEASDPGEASRGDAPVPDRDAATPPASAPAPPPRTAEVREPATRPVAPPPIAPPPPRAPPPAAELEAWPAPPPAVRPSAPRPSAPRPSAPRPSAPPPSAPLPSGPRPLIVAPGVELGQLAEGERVYADRDFTYQSVPWNLQGLTTLRTPNAARRAGRPFSFTVSRDVEVFVAHDLRIRDKPAWLEAFERTNLAVKVTADDDERKERIYQVFVKEFPAGVVTLGPNAPAGSPAPRASMYAVFVRPK